MAALTGPRPQTAQYSLPYNPVPAAFTLPVETGVTIYQGGMVVVNGGNAYPAGNASGTYIGGRIVGMADVLDQGAGISAFTISTGVRVREGTFLWDISGTLTQANFGQVVYAVDDHTVTAVYNSSTAFTVAGIFVGLDSQYGTYAQVLTIFNSFGSSGGLVTLNGSGTATVADTSVGAASIIVATIQQASSAAATEYAAVFVNPGVGFTINSSNNTSALKCAWVRIS